MDTRTVCGANINRFLVLRESSNKYNVRSGIYLKYIQDLWKEAYPEIDGRTAIMATLYNVGAMGSYGPRPNPKSTEFGDFAKDNYYYVRELMGI